MKRRHIRNSWLGSTLLSLLLVAAPGTSHAEAYPSKPIALVVTFAAGGGTDVLARLTAKYLSPVLGQPVDVVNKPGGNSIPGVLSVLNAPADGYTLLFDGPATSSLQALIKNLPYKVEKRTWGPRLTVGPYVYAVNAKSKWKTLKDVAEAARKDPSSFRMAWLGGASFTDTTLLKFLDVAGVDIAKVRKVPFRGSGPAMTSLAGGHIDFSGGNVGAAIPLLAAGDVRVVAVSGDQRVAALPGVPSSKEAGLYVPLTSWNSISGPAGMPKEVLDRIDQAIRKITEDPGFAKDLGKIGNVPFYTPPSKMWASVQEEAKVLREVKAKINPSK
jgi:tripartite-type tricarboxylate transporter receptor subunit TctC